MVILLFIYLLAAYQVENAALAFLTPLTLRDIPEAGTLKERLTVETIKNGFEKVRWQGRMGDYPSTDYCRWCT